MAPPRPYWKGYLKLSLVSCPIALYTATSSAERVAFRQISKKTGNRLRQQLVDEGTSERVVMLQPWGKGLLATTLRYPYEVRDAESYFDDIGEVHISNDMLALAE